MNWTAATWRMTVFASAVQRTHYGTCREHAHQPHMARGAGSCHGDRVAGSCHGDRAQRNPRLATARRAWCQPVRVAARIMGPGAGHAVAGGFPAALCSDVELFLRWRSPGNAPRATRLLGQRKDVAGNCPSDTVGWPPPQSRRQVGSHYVQSADAVPAVATSVDYSRIFRW